MGKIYSLLILCLNLSLSMTLMPKRLPNGKPYKYKANMQDRSSDLKVIKPGQASLITRNWLQNIVADLFNRENKKLINKEFTKTEIYN